MVVLVFVFVVVPLVEDGTLVVELFIEEGGVVVVLIELFMEEGGVVVVEMKEEFKADVVMEVIDDGLVVVVEVDELDAGEICLLKRPTLSELPDTSEPRLRVMRIKEKIEPAVNFILVE